MKILRLTDFGEPFLFIEGRISMDIKSLTDLMHDFVNQKGWYAEDSKKRQTPKNLVISLNLEAAEILELFQWNEKCEDLVSLSEELADVALYLLQIASISGINLEEAILNKLSQNTKRIWQ